MVSAATSAAVEAVKTRQEQQVKQQLDAQLNRVEFGCALIRMAVERCAPSTARTKRSSHNEQMASEPFALPHPSAHLFRLFSKLVRYPSRAAACIFTLVYVGSTEVDC